MFEKEPPPEQVPAKPLTQKQIAARLRAKKINVVGVIVCASLCVLLGVVSAVLPAGVSTPWMFASYAAGYIGVIWALAGMWSHFMGPNAPK
jgi:protein-S-isoprenylcysteine O-methyltransferase Ste14